MVVSRSAEAQTAIPDCGNDAACLSLYERASQESKNGNLVEAVRFYRLAYEVRADPKLLFSIARLLHRLDRKQEAILYYRQFIDSPLDNSEQKRKAEQYLEQARQGSGAMSSSTPFPATARQPITQQISPITPQPTTPPQPIPLQTNVEPTSSAPPAPPLSANPQPSPSLASATPAIAREPSPTKRPRWRLLTGGVAIGAGIVLTGFGGSALAVHGNCIDMPTVPGQTCNEVFATKPVGGALLGAGAAVVLGGIVLMAWP